MVPPLLPSVKLEQCGCIVIFFFESHISYDALAAALCGHEVCKILNGLKRISEAGGKIAFIWMIWIVKPRHVIMTRD